MLGYMEQTVSNVITKATTAVGLARPKYPFLSCTDSAKLYVAMYLKAHNPRSNDAMRRVWRTKLKRFEEKCDLVRFLGANMQPDYEDGHPLEFDGKLAEFCRLEKSV